jgi:glucosylceramidase
VKLHGALVLCLLAPAVVGATGGEEAPVSVWVTTADGAKKLKEEKRLVFTSPAKTVGPVVHVDDAVTYQTIDGFGASLTDSSAFLIWKLGEQEREALMQTLFDAERGIGLSFLRQPMAATDFSTIGNYSYDDPPDGKPDPELAHFTIAHDRKYILPELRQARSINPNLKIMASPWSPPAWMKTSGSMIGGTLLPTAREAWARYFVKFVEAYREQGVTIDYLSLQNEPLNVPEGYPGMGMDAATQVDLLVNHLAPALERAAIKVPILGWDHNWTNPYPYDVLKNKDAYARTAGTAWHCYGGNVDSQTELRRLFPDRDHWQTECSGFAGKDFAAELRHIVQTLVIGVTRHWGRSSVRWNLALDEKLGPQNGGCPNCTALVTIDGKGDVTYNVDYYALGHASKFVPPGAVRIESNTFPGGIENAAFLNPDGTRVVIAFNAAKDKQDFTVSWSGRSFSYRLPPGAAATFRWQGGPPPPARPAAVTVASAANLAARKPARASSAQRPDTDATLAVDGNGLTRWSSGFSDPQWLVVDLEAPTAISRVRLAWEAARARAYQVQVSNDGQEWGTVAAVANGDGGVDDHKVSAVARYVRVYGTARTTEYGYSLWEMEVYGPPAPTAAEVAEVRE